MNVRGLAYVAVETTSMEAWREFGRDVLGTAEHPESSPELLLLRMDDRAYRVAVAATGRDGMSAFGLELVAPAAVELAADELRAAGVEVEESTAAARAVRRVQAMVACHDPAGNRVELVAGHASSVGPFVSPTGARFVSDDLVGMGHVVLPVADYAAALDFYTRVLGFRLTDTMDLGPMPAAFLHCHERHHTVAVMGAGADAGLHHFMVEVDDMDAVGRSWDQCGRRALKIEMTLGRHSNDGMFSFYVFTPSGFSVEYGWGGLRLPAEWTATHIDRPSFWGHQMQA